MDEALKSESAIPDNYGRPLTVQPLQMRTFRRFSRYIQESLGIKMPDVKRTMLQARLQRRLRELRMLSFEDYFEYLFSPEGRVKELSRMIDAVTTNKTEFFREAAHFNYLSQRALPKLAREYGVGFRRPALVWSAGCSTGEEPYTLAMVLQEYSLHHSGFKYGILATDVSMQVLRTGEAGIYPHERVDPVPMPLRKKYLLRSKDKKKDQVRVASALRAKVRFRRINFMDDDFGIRETADVVFCRNVLIYFNRTTQSAVIRRLCRHLLPGGYLFTGHSETLNGLDVPLVQETATVYRHVP